MNQLKLVLVLEHHISEMYFCKLQQHFRRLRQTGFEADKLWSLPVNGSFCSMPLRCMVQKSKICRPWQFWVWDLWSSPLEPRRAQASSWTLEQVLALSELAELVRSHGADGPGWGTRQGTFRMFGMFMKPASFDLYDVGKGTAGISRSKFN